MVEAAIALPLIILSIMLLIRLFTFYLEILSTGIQEHEKAIESLKQYDGVSNSIYENIETIKLVSGGVLETDLNKEIYTKAYLYNEDSMVRIKCGLKNEDTKK